MTSDPVVDGASTSRPLDQSRGFGSGGLGKAARPLVHPDPLYGQVRVAGWAAALLATPPFQRLAGVSLSDVPGELLFGRPFPSRLDHAIGVYALARLARPRDRALQAAALAHDLGHGPFSHLTEPLMIERHAEDHEARSARLLADVRAALPAQTARQ
ncbi:MAG: HD domain-containing protein, partial [Ktedonobacterales bacterium]